MVLEEQLHVATWGQTQPPRCPHDGDGALGHGLEGGTRLELETCLSVASAC